MSVVIREYRDDDVTSMMDMWNEVVREGNAFPQKEPLSYEEAKTFFASQSFTGVAEKDGVPVGLYILHPNNVGRCGHLSNASYAVKSGLRGLRIGERLVRHSLEKAKELGFRVLQFNAVVATNIHARHLYERLGFQQLGVIPGGFRMKDGHYEDICPYYHVL